MEGISYLFFLRELTKQIESDWSAVLAKLEAVRDHVVNRSTLLVNATFPETDRAAVEPHIAALVQALPERTVVSGDWSPDLRPADEGLHAARDVVLARARHGDDEALADALAEVAGRVNEQEFAELLQSLAGERGRLRRMLARHGGIGGYRRALHGLLEIDEAETDDGIIAAACAPATFDDAGLGRASSALSEGSPSDGERGAVLAGWLADQAAREAGWEAYVRIFLTAQGGVTVPDRAPQVIGIAVGRPSTLGSHEPALGGDHDPARVLLPPRQGLGDQRLVVVLIPFVLTVGIGRVNESDAPLQSSVDHLDGLLFDGPPRQRQVHGTQSHGADFDSAVA